MADASCHRPSIGFHRKKHDIGIVIFSDFGILEGALCGHFDFQIEFRSLPGTQLHPEGPSWDPRVVGIGFTIILGCLWTTLSEVNFQVLRQAADLGLLFL